jgi:menaquinone-9 beta-reductase
LAANEDEDRIGRIESPRASVSSRSGSRRVLADQLLKQGDWSVAAEAYADEHDRHYDAIHRMTSWARHLLYDTSRAARELREHALPRLVADRTRNLDILGLGPDFPADEFRRRRYFCED